MKESRLFRIFSYIPAWRSERKSTARLRDFRGAWPAISGRTTKRCFVRKGIQDLCVARNSTKVSRTTIFFEEEIREPVTKGHRLQHRFRSIWRSFQFNEICFAHTSEGNFPHNSLFGATTPSSLRYLLVIALADSSRPG